MRQITKDITLTLDSGRQAFRLTKLDAFSGAVLLRLLLKLEDEKNPTIMDLIYSLSEEDLRSVMTACLSHTEVLLPAGPHPVLQSGEWSWPELEHDILSCMRLVIEEITWSLSGFFGAGGPASPPAPPPSFPPNVPTSTSSSFSR